LAFVHLLTYQPLGAVLRLASRGKWLKHLEEREDFVVPAEYLASPSRPALPHVETADTLCPSSGSSAASEGTVAGAESGNEKHSDCIIVTWYGDDDPANPQNWSLVKKSWVLFVVVSQVLVACR